MKTATRLLVLISALLSASILRADTNQRSGAGLDTAHTHKEIRAILAKEVAFISREFKVPIVAELVKSDDKKFSLPAGAHTARQLLTTLVSQAPDYTWSADKGVVHFYQKDLVKAQGNFLNLKLKTFSMPKNVSDLKMNLKAVLYSRTLGLDGMVMSDMSSKELESEALPSQTFTGATGRQILLAASQANPNFTSIIVFPRTKPNGKQDNDFASQNWFWLSTSDRGESDLH